MSTPVLIAQRILILYKKIFYIEELQTSKAVQWSLGASLFSFFVSFEIWSSTKAISTSLYAKGVHLCWPHFQSCGKYFFLEAMPWGYSQSILYMVFFTIIIAGVYFLYKKEWVQVHLCTLVLFTWKALYLSTVTLSASNNYDFYHLVFTFIILFLPYKEFFLQLSAVLLYFLSSTIKIHEGWVTGTIFTSLENGLPIFNVLGNNAVPVITNTVILFQIIFCWYLMSGNKLHQKLALIYAIIFHLYSGTLVGYHYPSMILPETIIIFGLFYSKILPPLDKKSLTGWLLVIGLFMLQSVSILIPKDVKMTLEGNAYGLYMFEANHQCIIQNTIYFKDGSDKTIIKESVQSMDRCDPYYYYFFNKQQCERNPNVKNIKMVMDHSINGGPFYRIVNETAICDLVYKPFTHNKWIRTPDEGAPIVGYPFTNFYRY